MTVTAYAAATSCAHGESLLFHVQAEPSDLPVRVSVADATDDRRVLSARVDGPEWTLTIPADWHSSLYRARFLAPGQADADLPWPREQELPGTAVSPPNEVYFVLRPAVPRSPVLLSVPFTTWQAYNRAGEPGQSIYWTEEPTRASRVTFDRPGGGPPPERWEEGMLRWLRPSGYTVDLCSNLDLHDGLDLLSGYRLLIVSGHDEYWSAGMRDAAEEFVRRGGNIAFFAGNTCWWQIRLEDDRRTMVCHRDPMTDPSPDPRLVTTEWSAAPVNRPENTLTGVSFRQGAGAWGPYMPLILKESYTVRFAEHWVFEGTGLADGDPFGQGTLGYETDAAEYTEVMGVPRVTARDGTPSSFVVLATADLRHWSAYGQGGAATMGVFTSGRGTVFNAATINWGNALDDPVVDRITRNVIDRLSAPAGTAEWEVIGPAADMVALAGYGRSLFGVGAGGILHVRELCGQNLPWRPIADAGGVRCLDVPREAAAGLGIGLYGVTPSGVLRHRPLPAGPGGWTDVCRAPAGTVALAIADGRFYTATTAGRLYCLAFADAPSGAWADIGPSADAVALSGMTGRLYAMDAGGAIHTRLPPGGDEDEWRTLSRSDSCVVSTTFTAHAGRLVTAGPAVPLRWRTV
ncbi:N,N-dimethylformamidase beta subunit family domain-containing protein [Spongiactinospora sp. 9N601]|uniref:N,N-dimethylformamidase beta subunit family domain-containing protein n=1 Tax=Spongiactinospora sp. 9N601 TaxID=3375149 RepID=UPI0037AE3313